jgi:pSer/pThr/pTyr-binding forkhead associated (FHA) protein
MAYVEIKSGKAVMQTALTEDAMSLGRLPGNFIVINDPDISRRHCVIERVDGAFSVYDLGSRNGTKVNGARITRVNLQDGDVITIGTTLITFVAAELRPTARQSSPVRALAWVSAAILLLLTAFLAAWAMGLLGDRFPPEDLRRRVGQSVATPPPDDEIEAETPTGTVDANEVSAPLTTREPRLSADGYLEITPEFIEADADEVVGRFASAQFVGRPAVDENGLMLWELPPDGTVTAVFEASAAEAEDVLDTLMSEPMLLQARVSGRIERDPQSRRLLLRVATIEVMHAWGGKDESLQPATRTLIGQPADINPRYAVQHAQAGD